MLNQANSKGPAAKRDNSRATVGKNPARASVLILGTLFSVESKPLEGSGGTFRAWSSERTARCGRMEAMISLSYW